MGISDWSSDVCSSDLPDRLRVPVIKKNGTWHEVGWEEALRHCERIAHPVIKQYGSQALAAYTGNMIAKSFDLVRYVGYFFQKLKVGGIYGRSEERRVGKECVRRSRDRRAPDK